MLLSYDDGRRIGETSLELQMMNRNGNEEKCTFKINSFVPYDDGNLDLRLVLNLISDILRAKNIVSKYSATEYSR